MHDMISGRPKAPLTLIDEERAYLQSCADSRTLPHALVCRQVVLWSADGDSNTRIARRLRWTNATARPRPIMTIPTTVKPGSRGSVRSA
jgi:DNA-binding CsgD family transcriptional regulator